MSRVVIVDYELGNVGSVARAVEECGGKACISFSPDDFAAATHLILPGVGTFADGMKNIRARGLDILIKTHALERQLPLLGVCLGMQLLATTGEEGGECAGLGLISGNVTRLKSPHPETRIPHTGWNEVHHVQQSPLLAGISSGRDFYFVHSYHFAAEYPANILAETPYCGQFVSAVGQNSIFGVQFHPEKSLRAGLQLLRNFLAL